ncbi:Splicing factor spf30 [Cytospora mali]|uniref:Splicing factor spf30 n=1 Tax=Cytospora mali TaxID=578113 RepID=A0A194VZN5_CYTMA|nr:Splicing factor spf30 [Valsa mali]
MSAQLAQLEEEKNQYQEQLNIVLTSLQDDPESAELLGLKAELDLMINMINESIADIQPKRATASAPTQTKKAPTPEPPAPEKWSRENHPAFKKAAQEEKDRQDAAAVAAAESATPISYQVNDTVLAKWLSGDKGFYPARITSVTGSSTQPIYTVKFKSYDGSETLRSKDIRPINNKRKADGSSTAATPSGTSGGANSPTTPGGTPSNLTPGGSTVSNNGIVLTSAPSVYPQAEKDAAAEGEKPAKKFKKIKATKELEKGKNKWQEFNSKSKFGKTQKKDSMFRTPDGVHGRVGFTGSGQAMRKDPTRSRHIYQPNEDID